MAIRVRGCPGRRSRRAPARRRRGRGGARPRAQGGGAFLDELAIQGLEVGHGGEDGQVGVHPADVAPARLLDLLGGQSSLDAEGRHALHRSRFDGERVLHLLERDEEGLAQGERPLLDHGARALDLGAALAAVDHRGDQARGQDRDRPVEEVGEGRRVEVVARRQREAREARGDGGGQVAVREREPLEGRVQVGSPREEGARDVERREGRELREDVGRLEPRLLGRAPREHRELVERALAGAAQQREFGARGLDLSLLLEHVDGRAAAVLEARARDRDELLARLQLVQHEALEGGVLDGDEPRIGGATGQREGGRAGVGAGRRGREARGVRGGVDATEQVDLVAEGGAEGVDLAHADGQARAAPAALIDLEACDAAADVDRGDPRGARGGRAGLGLRETRPGLLELEAPRDRRAHRIVEGVRLERPPPGGRVQRRSVTSAPEGGRGLHGEDLAGRALRRPAGREREERQADSISHRHSSSRSATWDSPTFSSMAMSTRWKVASSRGSTPASKRPSTCFAIRSIRGMSPRAARVR